MNSKIIVVLAAQISSELIDRLEYCSMSKAKIKNWVKDHWKSLFGYSSKVNMLVNGWFVFIFPLMKMLRKF